MSSINSNGTGGPYSANNDGSQATMQQLQQQQAEMQVRKQSDKALLENQKEANLDIIKLVGMSPTDATAEINGTPKSNKYSAAGAISSLPAPSAPKTTVTPRTQSLYNAMHNDMNVALGSVQSGEQPINWSALTPTMTATSSPAESAKQVESATAAATSTVKAIGAQYAKVSSSAMTMAFLMLRSQGQESGLNINNQMGEMQSAIRKADLDEQIKSDKEAQVKLDKAAKKQAAMKKAGPIIEAIIAVIMAVITVLSAGSATALALVVAAMVIGFVAGGAIGGAKKGNGFDFGSAITGLSIGEMIVPVKAIIEGIIKGITKAVEKGIATALRDAAKSAAKSAKATFSKSTVKATAETTGGAAARGAAKQNEEAARKTIQNTSTKLEREAQEQADKAAAQAAAGQAKAGADAGEQTPNFVGMAAHHIVEEFQKLLPAILKDNFSVAQKWADKTSAFAKSHPLMPKDKLLSAAQNVLFAGQFVTNATQMGFNAEINHDNIAAQKDLLSGKQWGQMAKIAQESWKNTQDFLSAMQDQHNTGITQIQQILAAKNQASILAISHISG